MNFDFRPRASIRRPTRTGRRGAVLLATLIALFVMVALTGVIVQQAVSFRARTTDSVGSRAALSSANAAVDLTVGALQSSGDPLAWVTSEVVGRPTEFAQVRFGAALGQVAMVGRTRAVGLVSVDKHTKVTSYGVPQLRSTSVATIPTEPLPRTPGEVWAQAAKRSPGAADVYQNAGARFFTRISFYKDGVAVNAATTTDWDRLVIEGISTYGNPKRPKMRVVEASLEMSSALGTGGAIISVMRPANATATGTSKAFAQTGHVVITGDPYVSVDGDILSNGSVMWNTTALTATSNPASYFTQAGTGSTIRPRLKDTPDEIPDYTGPGSADQLFDFSRYEAAAVAMDRILAPGVHSNVFNNLAEYCTSLKWHNAQQRRLNGIVLVRVNAITEGNNPHLEDSTDFKKGQYGIPKGSIRPWNDPTYPGLWSGGIHVQGTLMYRFTNVTGFYKIFHETPVAINPTNTGAGYVTPTRPLLPLGPGGYPPVFDIPERDPTHPTIQAAMAAAGKVPFGPSDDLPALMFENGVVDLHHDVNISGVVYGPDFLEVENKSNQRQMFNGSLVVGGGVYLEGGDQVFSKNPAAIDRLAFAGAIPPQAILISMTVSH